MDDTAKYEQGPLDPAIQPLPNTSVKRTTLKLYGKQAVDKKMSFRAQYIFDRFQSDDFHLEQLHLRRWHDDPAEQQPEGALHRAAADVQPLALRRSRSRMAMARRSTPMMPSAANWCSKRESVSFFIPSSAATTVLLTGSWIRAPEPASEAQIAGQPLRAPLRGGGGELVEYLE